MKRSENPRELLRLNAAAQRCGLHRERLRQAIRDGELPAYRIGHWWRVRLADLDKWLEGHRHGPPSTIEGGDARARE